jgi:hypothetical protein
MSNDELMSKFRRMLDRRKREEPVSLSANNTFDSSSFPNINSNANQNSQTKNSTQMAGEEKIISQPSKFLDGDLEEKEKEETQRSNQITRGRPSVFKMAKRFENRDLQDNKAEPPQKEETKKIDDKKEYKKINNVNIQKYVQSSDRFEKNDDEGKDSDYEDPDYYLENQRTSTNRELVRASLNKLREEYNISGDIKDSVRGQTDRDIENKERSYSLNNSFSSHNLKSNSEELLNLSSHIITDIPRKSVHQIVKMTEKRIMKEKEEKLKKQQQRYSVNHNFRSNVNNISRYLHTLKESPDDDISSDKFLKKNSEKLKQFGISEKDHPIVQELIIFFANSEKKQEKEREKEQEAKSKKQRNTTSNFSSFKNFDWKGPIIKEEEEECSLVNNADSNSNSVRFSTGQKTQKSFGEKRSPSNNQFGLINQLSDESISNDSQDEIENSKFMDIEIKGDDECEVKKEHDEKEKKNSPHIEITLDRLKYPNPQNFDSNRLELNFISNKPNRNTNFRNIAIIKSANNEFINLRKSFIKDLKLSCDYFSLDKSEDKTKSLFLSDIEKIQQSLFSLNSDKKLLLQQRIKDIDSKNKIDTIGNLNYVINPKEIKPKLVINKVNDFFLEKLTSQIKDNKSSKNDIITSSEQFEYPNSNNSVNIKPEISVVTNKQELDKSQNLNITQSNKNDKEDLNINERHNITKMFLDDRSYQQDEEEISRVRANLNLYSYKDAPIMKSEPNTNTQIDNFYSSYNNNSKYQKNIINSLDSIAVAQYSIHSSVPLDQIFFDVICINCYDCVKFSEVDKHGDTCVVQEEENYVELDGEEDYNARIYKLHESLKKKQNEIYKTNDEQLIFVYEELASLVYEILINNNSIEELDLSIAKLNEILTGRLNSLNSFYKFTFVIFGKRLSQLVYAKLKDMEKILMCVKQENDDELEVAEDEEDLEDESPENVEQIQLLKRELANLEQQTLNAKHEIEQWKRESKMLENMMKRPTLNNEMLSDIASDVMSRRDESVRKFF